MKINTIIKGTILTLALTAAGANASTQGNTDLDSVKVDVRGLDLSTDRGQDKLHTRLQAAAKKICGSSSVTQTGSVYRARDNKVCYDKTLSKAVKKVNDLDLAGETPVANQSS